MKLVIKIFVLVCVLGISHLTQLRNNVFLKTSDDTCQNKKGTENFPENSEKNRVFPEAAQKSEAEVNKKAVQQNEVSLNLFSKSGATLDDILATAAKNLKSFWKVDIILNPSYQLSKANRSMLGGILEYNIDHFKSLKSREEENEEVAPAVKALAEKISSIWATYSTIQNGILDRLANKKATGQDRAVFMGICGDIGTALIDYDPSKDNKAFKEAFTKFAKFYNPQNPAKLTEDLKPIRGRGGSPLTNFWKKIHRYAVFDNMSFRSGVFNLNDMKDRKKNFLGAKWPRQWVPGYFTNCKEPWAGHYSGSIVELHLVLDILTKRNIKASYAGKKLREEEEGKGTAAEALDAKPRKCIAAVSSAFLVGIGYHTAIEVEVTNNLYLGKPKPKMVGNHCDQSDMKKNVQQAKDNCSNDATKNLVALMKECQA